MSNNDLPAPTFKNPNFLPYKDLDFKGTWIRLTSYELKQQTAFNKGGKGGLIVNNTPVLTWEFLAPNQIMESVNSSWEPWETISSRLAGKGKEFVQMGKELTGVVSALSVFKGGLNLNKIGEAYQNLSSISKAKFKVDTPLVYENTERREWTMEFNLSVVDNLEAERMLESVRMLETSAVPARTDEYSGLGIDYPYIFSIKSIPNENLMKIDFAALTSVQPTFKAPYDEFGNPMFIDLSLTFKELPPLYADSF